MLPSDASTRALIASIAPATWLLALPVWADEAAVQAAATAGEVSSSGSGDLVVNVMFTLVTIFLATVTGGVSRALPAPHLGCGVMRAACSKTSQPG